MSGRTFIYACAFFVLSLFAPTAIATAGDTCPCKEVSDAECLKPATNLAAGDLKDGQDAGPCGKVQCETWECSEDGATAHCIEKLMTHKLVRKPYTENCIVKVTDGQTFLTPYTANEGQDYQALRQKPSEFSVRFGANERCWVFHGEDHLLDTEDPQQLTNISSLPLESCKPLKIKCADRVRSAYDFAFPGPAIMLEFFVPNGPVDGLGVSPRENAALSSTEAKTNYGTDAYTPERLAKDEGFKPLFADNSQTAEIFAKFPAWEKAFSKAGKLTTLPLIVNPASGFESEQMAWFIVTPPYCTYPYIQ